MSVDGGSTGGKVGRNRLERTVQAPGAHHARTKQALDAECWLPRGWLDESESCIR